MSTQLALALGCQRWTEGRDSYQPPEGKIDPREYDVAPIPESDAKPFVLEHHYSRSYPAARRRFGLFRRGALSGVAVFSVPMSAGVFGPFPAAWVPGCVELGRLVLLDSVEGNGESWFLARCFAALRAEGFRGVVSFSDPVPRVVGGRTLFRGHLGVIYQALNAVYSGRSTPQTLRLLPDGRTFSARQRSKIRDGERGWRYCAELLEQHGAAPLDDPREGKGAAWLEAWIPRITTPLRHGGNHRYLWALQRREGRLLPSPLPYPKQKEAA